MNRERALSYNRLGQETSPYLLQHKDNPVEWWPWGEEAFAEATRTGKPVLLSVGYAACHWCHVMAHESFEDAGTARVMNELFVNIKVDREERPDVDALYMNALHQLGEQGGWPLTMFLTGDGEPFWGGTYFPKEQIYGRAPFTHVLREISRIYREERPKIRESADALKAAIQPRIGPSDNDGILNENTIADLAARLAQALDPVNGGLMGAPKFPNCVILGFLWKMGLRYRVEPIIEGVEQSLLHICQGGIYEHLGGGFARYAVDERWLVPHFEKMLYDNAQLLELLALAWQRGGNPLYRRRARETVAWLAREMTTPEGAFCASLDADSEGEEGKFYVWSLQEIIDALGKEDAAFFVRHYGVTEEGNFEGRSILNNLARSERSGEDEARLASLRTALLTVRDRRVRPGLDDKVLADWNGLMIAALVNAGIAFDEPRWIELARRAFGFITEAMTRAGRLGHSWREGRLLFPGLASDFAAMIRAALALHEATGERAFLDWAQASQTAFDQHYANPETGGYFLTADDAEGLVLRPAATTDDATPNANALAAQNLVRLASLTGNDAWRAQADRLFDGIIPIAAQNLFGHVALLNALDLRLRAAEIVVTGKEAERFAAAALKIPFIDRIVLRAASAQSLPAAHPAQAKIAAAPEAAAFVCVGETCSLPITQAEQIAETVSAMRK